MWLILILFNSFIINEMIPLFKVRERPYVSTGFTSLPCDTQFVLPPSGI